MHSTSIVALLALVAETIIQFLLVIHVIMRRRSVSESLAWIILLVFAPILGPVLYILVGEPRLGARRIRRHDEVVPAIVGLAVDLWRKRPSWMAPQRAYDYLARLGTTISGLPPLQGNQIEILGDNDAFITRLIVDIDAATLHCHLSYYIWSPHDGGDKVVDALIRAAGRGVSCRVLVDGVGSRDFLHSDLPKKLRAAGVGVETALPVNPVRFLFARLDLRNHRKLAIIDNGIAFVGSQNLADSGYDHRNSGPWVDLSLRICGPAAQAVQTVFLGDWQMENESEIDRIDSYFPDLQPGGDSVIHILPSGPGAVPDTIHEAFLALLFSARSEILMSSPYFVPDEATMAAFRNAALRGVAVTLIVTRHLDTPIVSAASHSCYQALMDVGVKIVEFPRGILHAKTAIIDSKLAVVGSANFDMRSFWLNFEITIFLYDEPSALKVREALMVRLRECEPIDPEQWRTRSVLTRLIENAAQLLSPVL